MCSYLLHAAVTIAIRRMTPIHMCLYLRNVKVYRIDSRNKRRNERRKQAKEANRENREYIQNAEDGTWPLLPFTDVLTIYENSCIHYYIYIYTCISDYNDFFRFTVFCGIEF